MIIGRQPETPDFLQGTINWDMELSSAAQVVMSLPVARMAAGALFDSVSVMSGADPTFPVFNSVDDVLMTLAGEVDCTQVGESNILAITYSHIHSGYALAVVEHIIDAYMSFSIKSQQNLPAVEYYTDQIENLHVEIDTLFQHRVDIVNKAGVAALAGNTSAIMHQIRQLETSMLSIRSERKALEARMEDIEDAILNDPSYLPTSSTGAYSQTLKKRADELLTELADLRSRLQEGSGRITNKEKQLGEVWKEISRERDYYLRGLLIEINELTQRENSFRESILAQEAQLEDYPDVQRRIEAIDVQIKSQLDLLETLEMKRGEVKLKAGADIRVSNIFRLDEPFITMSLVGSKKSIYLATAALLAMVLGLITGWFVDNQDHRIYDRSQAVQALNVPVLGSISTDPADSGS
ncbi:hypothetical protein KKG45_02855 [bacterium]|nr:hypothetical protein [bacterium]